MQTDLAELMALDRDALVKHWQETFGQPPPSKCGTELVRQVLGWHMQVTRLGGLGKRDLARMKQAAKGRQPSRSVPTPGSQLVRLWQGRTHQVHVLDNGYHYDGRHWKSLSAIARAITGTPWSGPVFFGLKPAKSAKP